MNQTLKSKEEIKLFVQDKMTEINTHLDTVSELDTISIAKLEGALAVLEYVLDRIK